MTRAEAVRLARKMERHIERQWELGNELEAAAKEGCPVAMAVWALVEDNMLPHPTTAVENLAREALGMRTVGRA